MNFVNFSCMIYWAQNVLIPAKQNLSIPLDQNEYPNILAHKIMHEDLINMVQNLWNSVDFSCMIFGP